MEEFQMEKPKDSKTAVWIILIVVVGLIALAVGYLVGRGVQAKAPAAPIAETAVIETTATATLAATAPAASATTVTDTSSWKTYTNDAYGFSFKYPSDYTKNDLENGVAIDSATTGGYEQPHLVLVESISSDKTLEEYLATQIQEKTFTEQASYSLAGKVGLEGVDHGMANQYVIHVKTNSAIINIYLDSGNKDTLAESKSALTSIQKEILSTFQFTK